MGFVYEFQKFIVNYEGEICLRNSCNTLPDLSDFVLIED